MRYRMRMTMKWLIINALLISTAFSFESISTDQANYDQSLRDINSYLEYNQRSFRGCPGTRLVISCGNSTCEPYKNENIENCPADCLENVSVRSYNNITLCDEYTQTQIPKTVDELIN